MYRYFPPTISFPLFTSPLPTQELAAKAWCRTEGFGGSTPGSLLLKWCCALNHKERDFLVLVLWIAEVIPAGCIWRLFHPHQQSAYVRTQGQMWWREILNVSQGVFSKEVIGVEERSRCVLWNSRIGTFSLGWKVFHPKHWAWGRISTAH